MTKIFSFNPRRCVPESKASHFFDNIELKPGINYFSDSIASKLTAHPDYQRYLDLGAIALKEDSATAITPVVPILTPDPDSKKSDTPPDLKESNTPPNLNGYDAEGAKTAIAQQSDISVLEAWLSQEQRKSIKSEISVRIAALKQSSVNLTSTSN